MTDDTKPTDVLDLPDFGLRFDPVSESDIEVRKVVSHWVINSDDRVAAICETPEWKADRTLVARVYVNGVELDFADLDRFLYECFKKTDEKLEAKYADAKKAADEAAREILKERAAGVLEALDKIQDVLRDSESVIKPHWED
jgi:hypothetical protein